MPFPLPVAPLSSLVFSRKAAVLAAAMAMAIVLGSLGCMGLDMANQNGTLSQEGSVKIPPNTTLEVVYPTPFASPPTLTIYAWHSDWKITDQNEKSFKVFNKNTLKARNVEWKARGLRSIPEKKIQEPFVVPNDKGGYPK